MNYHEQRQRQKETKIQRLKTERRKGRKTKKAERRKDRKTDRQRDRKTKDRKTKNEKMKRQKDKMKKKKTERQRGEKQVIITFNLLFQMISLGPGSRAKKKIPLLTIFGVPKYASEIPYVAYLGVDIPSVPIIIYVPLI